MRSLRRSAANGLYIALAAILVGVVAAALFHRLNPQWAAAVSAAVSILGSMLASAQRGVDRRPPEAVASELAQQLMPFAEEQWKAELPARGLEPGRRMGLHWRLADGSNTNLSPGLSGQGTLEELRAHTGREAAQDRLPRLVITGQMGGGKTAACILLIVELAERRARLPVLFQLATWDPRTSLNAWMARQLPEIFPVLGRNGTDRKVAGIMASRHILPVLDGLDEMREPAAALKGIEQELGGKPFVLASRTAEFNQANAGNVLHQVLIAELQPLSADDVRGIFLDYEPPSVPGPLAAVAAELKRQPQGSVSEALSTPFMVSLARDGSASLPELASAPGPGAADHIRQQLLGTFLHKAYAADDRISPDEARDYLRFLAKHTDTAGRLAWWRLHLAVPRSVFLLVAIVIAGASCSALATVFFAVFDRPWLGFWIGLSAGIAGAFIVELVPQDDPRRARPRLASVRVPEPYQLARTIGFGAMGGAACAVIVWFLYGPVRYTVIGGVLSGLTYAVARYISQPNDPLTVVTPDSLLRADRTAVLYAWLVGAVPGALTGAYLGYSLPGGHRPALDGLALLNYQPFIVALLGAFGGCVLSAAGLGLMAVGSSSWGRFIWTRMWLAAHGHTPLQLMKFLQNSYRRGVLRQVNGYYEFRHRILQGYLAESAAGAPPDLKAPL